ncbi:MAG: hypothetical protein KDK66_03560 [Deltaproteobacteria bacterium]|nr:hypothetical protein [Deltaproteobacteria bacterium]
MAVRSAASVETVRYTGIEQKLGKLETEAKQVEAEKGSTSAISKNFSKLTSLASGASSFAGQLFSTAAKPAANHASNLPLAPDAYLGVTVFSVIGAIKNPSLFSGIIHMAGGNISSQA